MRCRDRQGRFASPSTRLSRLRAEATSYETLQPIVRALADQGMAILEIGPVERLTVHPAACTGVLCSEIDVFIERVEEA